MAAVIAEDNVYREAALQEEVPPADHEQELQLPGPDGNIQGQVVPRHHLFLVNVVKPWA